MKNRKRTGWKKTAERAITVLLVTGLLGGCGIQAKRPETNDSVKTEKEKTEQKERLSQLAQMNGNSTFVTDHCIYRMDGEFVQSDWKGKELDRISLGENEKIEGMSDKYICCSDVRENGECILYLAPVEQTKEGEKVRLEKKEKIAQTEDMYDVYVWGSNVYYTLGGRGGLYYYDAKRKKTKCLLEAKEDDAIGFCAYEGAGDGAHLICDGKIYLTNSNERGTSLYCIDRQTAKLDFLGEVKEVDLNICSVKENLVFCTCRASEWEARADLSTWYIVYDTKEKKQKAQLKEDQIEAFLKQQGLWKEGADFYFVGNFVRTEGGEQLDFVINMNWPEKVVATGGPQKGKEVEMSKSKEILLRCPWQELTALSYDKIFSQWMDEHVDDMDMFMSMPATSSMSSHYSLIPNVAVWNFYGEELLLCCMDLEKKDITWKKNPPDDYQQDVVLKSFELKAYDLESGKLRDIPKSDGLYQIIDAMR